MMVCFICQSSMIVGPALADLAAAYPNVPYANILLISTIPQLCGIPVSLITGKIAGSKVKYKTLAATCALIGGVLPFFIRSFPIILLSRVIFGLYIQLAACSRIGFACFVPALMMRVREKLPEEAISPAAGFASASHKTGAFLSAYYVGIVGKITGSDNPKMSILVAMIVIVVLAIPWIISIVRDKEAK